MHFTIIATDSIPITSSIFLESASISLSGSSEVTVDCKVANGYPEASCVLVYRKYDNTTLIVTELSHSILSITLNIDRPEIYTFAIFGRNGNSEIAEHPVFIVKFKTPSNMVYIIYWHIYIYIYIYSYCNDRSVLLNYILGTIIIVWPKFVYKFNKLFCKTVACLYSQL